MRQNWFKYFQIFAPPSGEGQQSRLYHYWRLRIFSSIYIGYAFFYLTRKSFNFAMPAMIFELGITKTELGFLGSILYITYGASKFLSGILGDQSNPRYFMSIGLIMTGLCNIFFGLSSTILFFVLFWGLNGWFQGWGWPPIAKLLTHWYSQSERGRWWGVWNTSHNLGGALIPIVVAATAQFFGWRVSMFLPGVLCIGMGFFLMNRLRDTPQSLGLPSIETFRNDHVVSQKEEMLQEENLSTRDLLVEYVLKNPYIWVLSVTYFFIYMVRTAINDWGLLYFVESKGVPQIIASSFIFAFEIGGFFGSLSAGWISDTLYKGLRIPVNGIFAVGSCLSCLLMFLIPVNLYLFYTVFMFLSGFFIFGPQMLIGVACAELSHKKASGTSTGFAGTFAYLGAATASLISGRLTEIYGWEIFFPSLSLFSLISFALLVPLWNIKANPRLSLAVNDQELVAKDADQSKDL
ncbi:MAG: phosphoglycerate transporter protein PgtP [Verrucomicrobia bacterium]|nr:phosphoglycerate transporter protein PgtP [Verrucomicrobiota bacterium]NDE63380.1 MFS transporter [Chlamydiota bacterium]